MIENGKRAGVRATGIAMAAAAAFVGASSVQAQMVVSAVESENSATAAKDKIVSNIAGQSIATTYGGADTRALTDYGVNKIKAQGNSAFEQYATSAWVDSYTVGGASSSMVDLSFTVSIDGLATFTGGDPAYNFKLYALRGNNWTATGYTENVPQSTPFNFTPTGDNLDRVFLNQTRADGGFTQMDARDFDGFSNYAPNGGAVGAFASSVLYDEAGDTYIRTIISGSNTTVQHFGPTGYRQSINGGPFTPLIPYSGNAALAQGRAGLVANYSMLDYAELCDSADNECPGQVFPGNDVTVSFSLMAGSTFSLAGIMFADDVTTGTVDFYNTARLTGVGVSNGGSLTSASGALVQQADGSYGYRAVIAAAVPEPSTWAMLTLGFGLVGGAMRTRRTIAFA